MVQAEPYQALAACYDSVMEHVDYDQWVEFIECVLDFHDHKPGKVIELGCGTATFSRLFTARNEVDYLATDASAEMLRVARQKTSGSDIKYAHLDFANLDLDFADLDEEKLFDTALLLYDGLNYIMNETDVLPFFTRVYSVLRPGGLFIFDQSTPANSLNNRDFFHDEGHSGSVSFVRFSEYDEETAVHTTRFEITSSEGVFEEIHHQKCYTGQQIQKILEQTDFEIEAGYHGFSFETADTESERIHWVVRKP